MTRTFVEMPRFTKEWRDLGLDDEDLRALQNIIMSDPEVGSLIRGTGGLRKMRFAYIGRGKSGSTRVIYLDYVVSETVFLFSAYEKSRKANLSQEEKNELKKLVTMLKKAEREARRNDNV